MVVVRENLNDESLRTLQQKPDTDHPVFDKCLYGAEALFSENQGDLPVMLEEIVNAADYLRPRLDLLGIPENCPKQPPNALARNVRAPLERDYGRLFSPQPISVRPFWHRTVSYPISV